jgi:gluconate 2-dehydrogenase gamma chain
VRRREALKAIVIGGATATVGGPRSVLRAGPLPDESVKAAASPSPPAAAAFTPNYFSQHEFAVVSRLADLIIPRDTTAGALDARVPEYIDLQVSEMPAAQTQISGGLQWLDRYCNERFSKAFLGCSPSEQTQVLDQLADGKAVPPGLAAARSFFVLVRALTSDGFYSSKLGFEELGYKGNTATEWHGCTHPDHGG